MQSKVALIVVFNHRYDKNIPVLEQLYEGRFSSIYHLVPFYDGVRENVIPVYESSFQFQGYLAQGLKQYFDEQYEHYLFVADDLLLNPAINETNYKEHFGLDKTSSFIPEIHTLHNLANNDTLRFIPSKKGKAGVTKWYWWRLKQLLDYRHENEGVETANEMPSYSEAEAILHKHGYDVKPLTPEDIFGTAESFADKKTLRQRLKFYYKRWRHRKGLRLPYPVVSSYSDIVIVSKPSIKKFAHYCGVFAANGLFVEFATPTALLLSCKTVVTEPALRKRGAIYWTYTKAEAENYAEALRPYKNDLSALLTHFPVETLYIHPIKLSKWQNKTVTEQASL